jgi:hypothetical protein
MISEPKWKNIVTESCVCVKIDNKRRVVRRSSISADADDGDCSALAVIDSVKRRIHWRDEADQSDRKAFQLNAFKDSFDRASHH